MGTVSTRIPESLKDELEEFIDSEKLDKSTAVRKLLSEGLEEWSKDKAVERLENGEVSFSKAAEIAGMDQWSFSNLLKEREAKWIGDQKNDLEAV